MRVRGYIGLAIAVLAPVLLVVSIAAGWLRRDPSEERFILIGLAVLMPPWFLLRHRMEVSAEQEIQRMQAQPGRELVLDDDWLYRWTLRGAAAFAGGVGLVAVVSTLTGDLSLLGEDAGSLACALVFVGLVAAISGGMIMRRQTADYFGDLLYREASQKQPGQFPPA